MCIGVWTLEHPDYALILCTNRDEHLDRPTQSAHFHSFETDQCSPTSSPASGDVLSGRDIKAGGTWFGLNRAGIVALLTNITEPPKSFTSSRGYLVSSFLLSDSSSPLEDGVGKVVPSDAQFAGFNLLLLAPTPPSVSTAPNETGTLEAHGQELEPRAEEAIVDSRGQKLFYDAILLTNHGAGGPLETRRLMPVERACGCMSNGVDGRGASEWPKVKKAASSLEDVLNSLPTGNDLSIAEDVLVEKLFDILTWKSPDPIKEPLQLRNTIQVVPIPVPPKNNDAKQTRPSSDPSMSAVTAISVSTPQTSDTILLAQPSIHNPVVSRQYYGTRLSTVLLIRRDGSVLFVERDIWCLGKDGKPERLDHSENKTKQRVFKFQLDLS